MIEYTVSGSLCILRLNNPPLNAITFEMLDDLRAAIDRAGADDSVSGIVITGAAGGFSAGADVNIFDGLSTDADAIETSRVFQEAFDAVEASGKPVAASVTGKVIGGFFGLISPESLEQRMAQGYRLFVCGHEFRMMAKTGRQLMQSLGRE